MSRPGVHAQARLASIHIYPMKAARAVDLAESVVEPWGLAGDRRWLLVDEDGRFVSQREEPSLARLIVTYGPPDGRISVSAPGRPGSRAGRTVCPTPERPRPPSGARVPQLPPPGSGCRASGIPAPAVGGECALAPPCARPGRSTPGPGCFMIMARNGQVRPETGHDHDQRPECLNTQRDRIAGRPGRGRYVPPLAAPDARRAEQTRPAQPDRSPRCPGSGPDPGPP